MVAAEKEEEKEGDKKQTQRDEQDSKNGLFLWKVRPPETLFYCAMVLSSTKVQNNGPTTPYTVVYFDYNLANKYSREKDNS